ncbi:hypothetical protein SELMODRAFT_426776 [Selaginella moellendorffii]|uniref:lysozyme n=1 Tax=Selaginella moellendorffii TaxID=88036 RepID=D8SXG3_SELML|nr:hypothetical protein SELMODRAFT_426776 [Selaginella moellendorffii]
MEGKSIYEFFNLHKISVCRELCLFCQVLINGIRCTSSKLCDKVGVLERVNEFTRTNSSKLWNVGELDSIQRGTMQSYPHLRTFSVSAHSQMMSFYLFKVENCKQDFSGSELLLLQTSMFEFTSKALHHVCFPPQASSTWPCTSIIQQDWSELLPDATACYSAIWARQLILWSKAQFPADGNRGDRRSSRTKTLVEPSATPLFSSAHSSSTRSDEATPGVTAALDTGAGGPPRSSLEMRCKTNDPILIVEASLNKGWFKMVLQAGDMPTTMVLLQLRWPSFNMAETYPKGILVRWFHSAGFPSIAPDRKAGDKTCRESNLASLIVPGCGDEMVRFGSLNERSHPLSQKSAGSNRVDCSDGDGGASIGPLQISEHYHVDAWNHPGYAAGMLVHAENMVAYWMRYLEDNHKHVSPFPSPARPKCLKVLAAERRLPIVKHARLQVRRLPFTDISSTDSYGVGSATATGPVGVCRPKKR